METLVFGFICLVLFGIGFTIICLPLSIVLNFLGYVYNLYILHKTETTKQRATAYTQYNSMAARILAQQFSKMNDDEKAVFLESCKDLSKEDADKISHRQKDSSKEAKTSSVKNNSSENMTSEIGRAHV